MLSHLVAGYLLQHLEKVAKQARRPKVQMNIICAHPGTRENEHKAPTGAAGFKKRTADVGVL